MSILTPSVPFYTIYLPNADTIVGILPFLLFGMLLLTAFFATFISYKQFLFIPDDKTQIVYSDWWIGLIPVGVLILILILIMFISLFIIKPPVIRSVLKK